MTDGAFPDRLAQLRNRWESDPTSRVFLQLAEEYRHQGRVKEALDILEKGLKEHPGYLSALVAKGRCLLELGEPEGARAVLERVVKQDATQMVANKLLVRAYLDTGEPDRARERLDLYSLLNDSDPEIEELRRRIRAMEQAPQAERPDPKHVPFPELAAPAPPPPRADQAQSGAFDVFDLGAPAPPRRPVEDVFQLEEPPAPPPPPPAAAAPEPAVAAPPLEEAEPEPEPEDGNVFPGLGTRASRQRHVAALESEGLFFWDAAPAPVAPEPVAEPAPEPEPEPALAAEPAWEVEEALPLVEAAAPWAPAPPAAVESEAPVFELDEPSPWAAAPVSLTPEPEPLPTPPAPEPIATATLGELYLRQGHLEEAERIFEEVLRREPGNPSAQAGLARLASLTAATAAAPPPAGAAGVNARKAFVLRQYLQRIREGSQRHVP
jgi:tetratricopeptide (TPR) repeat protein